MDQHRTYIDHPTSIPLQLREYSPPHTTLSDALPCDTVASIRCHWPRSLKPGTRVLFQLPSVRPEFAQPVVVRWCVPAEDCFEIGLDALNDADAFRLRMLEQLCHILQYQHEMRARYGRSLDSEQAAKEWIAQYAAEFPAYSN